MVKKRTSNKQVLPRLRVTRGGQIALGPGKVELLELLDRTGSISAAASGMKMSYMRAWMLIHTMNRCFKSPLVITERGGKKGGGGATLTDAGKRALTLYRQMHARCLKGIRSDWHELKGLLR